MSAITVSADGLRAALEYSPAFKLAFRNLIITLVDMTAEMEAGPRTHDVVRRK